VTTKYLLLATLIFAFAISLPADPGTAFTYQGRLADGATPIEVPVDLRFSLHDASTTGAQVGSSLEFLNSAYDGGIVQLDLDFGTGSFTGDPRWLQIELANPAGDSYTTLTPRIQILPAPYAMYAASAGTFSGDVDTTDTNELNISLALNGMDLELEDAGGVLTADLSPLAGSVFGDGHSLDAVDGDPVDALFVDAGGDVGIGLTDPLAELHVNGADEGFTLLSDAAIDGANGFNNLSFAFDVFVKDNIAYMSSFGDSALSIIDVSDPANPTLLSEAIDGDGEFSSLSGALAVWVDGNHAYVTSFRGEGFSIIDVSDPTDPALVSEIRDNQNGFNRLDEAWDIIVKDDVAYISSLADDAVTIVDVSNPANPTLLHEIIHNQDGFSRLNGTHYLDIDGDLLYVTSLDSDALSIIDISDPTSPTLVAEVFDGDGEFRELNGAADVLVSDGIAYVSSEVDDGITIMDVSDPSNPELLFETSDGEPGYSQLNFAQGIDLFNNILFISASLDSSVTILDVTNPSNPILIDTLIDNQNGFDRLGAARNLSIEGNTLYAVTGNTLNIIGIDVYSAIFESNVFAAQNLTVGGSIFGDGSQLTGISDNVDDADADPTNELISNVSLSGTLLEITEAGGTFSADLASLQDGTTDADADPTNELNTGLLLSGMNLELGDGGGTLTADLSPLAGSVFGDGHSLDAVDGTPMDALFVDGDGDVGIGLTAAAANLHVDGAEGEITLLSDSVRNGANGFSNLFFPYGVAVENNIAYIATRSSSSFTIIDVSDPSNPALLSQAVDGDGEFSNLSLALTVWLDGNHAYVSTEGDGFTIIDVSDPTDPAPLAEIGDNENGFTRIGGAWDIIVKDDFAYITSLNEDTITIADVSDPTSPTLFNEIINNQDGFSRLDGAHFLTIDGDLLYVTGLNSDALTIIDITDPANPTLVAEIFDGDGEFNELNAPSDVLVSDGIAYVLSEADDGLTIIDVSNPSNPELLFEVSDGQNGFNRLNFAQELALLGDMLFITAVLDNTITVVDVSDPENPSIIATLRDNQNGFNRLESVRSIAVEGNTLYALAFDTLNIIGLDLYSAIFDSDVLVNGELQVSGSLVADSFVGDGSGLTGISVSSLDASDGNPTDALAVDTDGDVGINTSSPAAALHVTSSNSFGEMIVSPNGSILGGGSSQISLYGADTLDDGFQFNYSSVLGDSNSFSVNAIDGGSLQSRSIVIESDTGQVGVGLSNQNPFATLHVADSFIVSPDSNAQSGGTGGLASITLADTASVLAGFEFLYSRNSSANDILQIVENPEGSPNTLVTIEDSGQVGIGTTEPNNMLHVESSGNTLMELESTGTGSTTQAGIIYRNPNDNWYAGLRGGDNDFIFFNGGVYLTIEDTGDIGIRDTTPDFSLQVGTSSSNGNGAHVTDGGVWTNGSSREWKTNFRELNPREILERLMTLQITRWEYKDNDEGDHIGPTAEDFRSVFGLGHSEQYIATVDIDGVALAAIQGLNEKHEKEIDDLRTEKDAEIKTLREEKDAQIDLLQQQIDELRSLIQKDHMK
jgi:hypothetical protein